MPHQCVRCNKIYDDGASDILKGCSCGGRVFFFIKKERLNKDKKVAEKLSQKQKNEIEKDVIDLVGSKQKEDHSLASECHCC